MTSQLAPEGVEGLDIRGLGERGEPPLSLLLAASHDRLSPACLGFVSSLTFDQIILHPGLSRLLRAGGSLHLNACIEAERGH